MTLTADIQGLIPTQHNLLKLEETADRLLGVRHGNRRHLTLVLDEKDSAPADVPVQSIQQGESLVYTDSDYDYDPEDAISGIKELMGWVELPDDTRYERDSSYDWECFRYPGDS